jgi:hypothetical protein
MNVTPTSDSSASDQPVVLYKDYIIITTYEKKKSEKTSDAVTASVSIEARNNTTHKVMWKRLIDSIWGGYEKMPFSEFGFYVKAMHIEQSEKDTDYLIVQTLRDEYYILNPVTGDNIIDNRKNPGSIDAPSSGTVFIKESMQFVPIQAVPGMGIRITMKNNSSKTYSLSTSYSPYTVEAYDAAADCWSPIAACSLGYNNVSIVKEGASVETFMTKEVLAKILLNGKQSFEHSLNEYNKRAAGQSTLLSPFTINYSTAPAVSHSAFRLVFTAFENSDTKNKFGRIRKIYLQLSPLDIIELLAIKEVF